MHCPIPAILNSLQHKKKLVSPYILIFFNHTFVSKYKLNVVDDKQILPLLSLEVQILKSLVLKNEIKKKRKEKTTCGMIYDEFGN